MSFNDWKRENGRTAALVFTVIYCLAMAFMLVIRPDTETIKLTGDAYWSKVKESVTLVPLSTIKMFWSTMVDASADLKSRDVAFVNLVGNVVLFIPIGWILPHYFRIQRNPLVFLFTTTVIISLVESAQALTLRGHGDIDDVILNVVGASLGAVTYFIIRKVFKNDKDCSDL